MPGLCSVPLKTDTEILTYKYSYYYVCFPVLAIRDIFLFFTRPQVWKGWKALPLAIHSHTVNSFHATDIQKKILFWSAQQSQNGLRWVSISVSFVGT